MVCLHMCLEFMYFSFCACWIRYVCTVHVDYVVFYCFFGFVLGYASAHEAQDMEEDVDVLDNEEGEPLEEFFYEPVKITEGVRRCNRSNGKGWFCRKLAHPGYAMCWDHVMNRRKYLQKRL